MSMSHAGQMKWNVRKAKRTFSVFWKTKTRMMATTTARAISRP